LSGQFAVCRLAPDSTIPLWGLSEKFFSITKSEDELTVVCSAKNVPPNVQAERDWRALKVESILDLRSTGILASLARPLAQASVSIFAISTYDTDYVLVREKDLSRAVATLREAGHAVSL
jgi:hypothetical protein